MAKRGQPPALSETQLEIMNVVWDRGETTVAEVWNVLSASRSVARNTVQTLMTRLEEKGWLRHRAEGQTFHYRAAHARRATVGRLVQRLVDTAFAGSLSGLMLALLEGRDIPPEEAERIRVLINQAEKKS